MSHIKNIEIKNFKSIRAAKIEDCRRVNVFIGYPNVGKSNILEALSFISYFKKQRYTPLKQLCRFKELIDIFSDGNRQRDAEIVIDNYVFALRFINKDQVDFAIVDKAGYVEDRTQALSHGLKNISFNKEGGLLRNSEKNYDDSESNLKKYVFRGLSEMSSGNNPTVLNFPHGENIAEILRYNSSLRKECGELFAEYNLKLVFDENANLSIQKQLDEFTAFQFSISQVADTLQRLIFHKAAIATNNNSILLFEEPEAHMFPPYISKFTAEVNYDENNNQFFIATHSPFVLNDFMEDMDKDDLAIYAVGYKMETGETVVRRITDEEIHEIYQYGIDLFFNLENFLKDAV